MRALFALVVLCSLVPPRFLQAQSNVALGKPVTTQYSTSTNSTTYPGGYVPANLTDGNLTTFSHPNTMTTTLGFRYDINLGRAYVLDRLRFYNRTDCCPDRLSNYRVSILADNGSGAPATPALWTAVIRANGTNSGASGVDDVLSTADPAGAFTGQWIRVENINESAHSPQVAEVQAISSEGAANPNLALFKPVTYKNSAHADAATFTGYPAGNINDDSIASFSYPAAVTPPATTLGSYYQIDFLTDRIVDRVVLYGRSDGNSQERLSNFRVALFADNAGAPGAQTWSADLHAGGTWPPTGGADTIRATDGAGDFHGRFLRVINLGGMAFNPQIGEIQVYRPPAPVINYFTTDAGNITATGAPGLPAESTLSWNVTGATSLSIDQGIGSVTAPSGTRAVSPAEQTTYTLTATNISGSATATLTIAVDAAPTAPRINEIMAENDGGLEDEDGSRTDWIEVFNPNPFTLGLAGAHLSDNPENPVKWAFPAGASIPPNGYLIVFASNKDRAVAGRPLHTNFELRKAGETLSLYGPGGVLWSRIPPDYPVTAMFPPQYRDTSYGVNGSGEWRYFRPSTPGAANTGAGYTAVVDDTSFAVKRGIYTAPQSVAITCATAGAQIRYTLNGTKPTATTGTVYTAPINVTATTAIRAAAFLTEAAPSNVDTHTYIFPGSVASQPTMLAVVKNNATWGPQIPAALQDVPSIALTTPNTAAYNDNTEIESAFEWIHNTDPLQNAHANCGVQYFGGAFTVFSKKSFRLYFRGLYGDKKLKADLFTGHEHGHHVVNEFDGLEIRNGSHDMNARGFYMSNLFTDELQLEMGHLAPHGRFIHVYLNGVYWGLYHLRERWNAAMHASYLGGQKEDYEAINGNWNVGGWAVPGEPFDGDGAAWEYAKARRTSYNDLRGLIDVPNFTDYMIIWMFGNAEDEWRNVGPSRLIGPGSGQRFINHDSDGWLSVGPSNTIAAWDSNENNTARASTWNQATMTFNAGRSAGDGPGSLLAAMYLSTGPNSDYRTLLSDCIHRALFNNGPLTPARNQARLDTMCLAIQRPFIAEAARWNYRLPADPPGGAQSSGDWEDAWTLCRNSWMPTRTNTVLTQFRNAGLYPSLNAPVFSQNGGVFSAGFTLGMTVAGAPAGSTIRYTLDGTDPRLPGGALAPVSLTFTANAALAANTVVKARTLTAAGAWSALQEAFFQLDTSSPVPAGTLVPSEMHFNPTGDDDAEFIELMNASPDTAINLRGCRFTAGINFAFSEYHDTLLAPGQRLVLVDSEFTHRTRYGWDRTIGGIYFDNLNNDGEQLAFNCGSDTVFNFTFSETWHRRADGGGPSLTLIHPRPGLDPGDPLNWRASQVNDGTPGAGDTGPGFTGTPGGDIDADGASALLEYAMGTSDTSSDSLPLLTFEPVSAPQFSFTRAPAADDAIVIAEISTDMTTWLSGPAYLMTVDEAVQPDGRLEVRMQPQAGALGSAGRFYARIRVIPR